MSEEGNIVNSKMTDNKENTKENTNSVVDFDFKKARTFEQRIAESTAIRLKNPDRVPVICEVHKDSRKDWHLDRNKYLVLNDETLGQYLFILRNRLALKPEEAMFIFTANGTIPSPIEQMKMLYREYKDKDGFLYMTVMKETAFGQN